MPRATDRAVGGTASAGKRPQSAPVLEAVDLVKHYPGVRAVDGISFAVAEGSCFGLLGPNGAGKTTTVEMLEGVLRPGSGEVRWRGRPIGPEYREHIGIQFQSTALQDFLTTGEHLRLFSRLYRRQADLSALVARCRLGEFLHRDARRLSGGQRQRLLLAIALVNDPDVVFLDEPTTGLDPQARRNFWELVREIQRDGKTVILTTHYMEEAYQLCDEIAIVDHGRIIAQGSPRDLLSAHFDDVVLELPAEDVPPAAVQRRPWRQRGGLLELSTADVNGVLAELLDAGASLRRLAIRPRTLEDLFLELTGRDLRA